MRKKGRKEGKREGRERKGMKMKKGSEGKVKGEEENEKK